MKLIGQETIVEIERRPALVHCSSVLSTHGGGLACVWYEGAYETSSNMRLMISRKPEGSAWHRPEVLFDFHGMGLGNPVLWRSSHGDLRLTFSALLSESWKESLLFVSSSRDEGASWSEPTLFVPRKGMMAKTRPIYGEGGQLIFPLYDEAQYCPYLWLHEGSDLLAGSFVAETMARGKAIQPVLARLADGRILMLCRTNQGALWQSYSSNDGYTWTILRPAELPNPDSAVDMIRLRDGRLLLAGNPSKVERKRLSAFVSSDAGTSWTEAAEIVSGEGEYSYPSLIEEEDGTLSVTYTCDRRAIVHARMVASPDAEKRPAP